MIGLRGKGDIRGVSDGSWRGQLGIGGPVGG